MKMKSFFLLLFAIFLLEPRAVWADAGAVDFQSLQASLDGLKQQITLMQQTIDQQNLRIQQLESRQVLETPPQAVAVEPAKPEVPSWLKGTKMGGDIRLRYENFNSTHKNDEAGSTGTATDRDRNRFRFRLRWGLEKELGEEWKLGFRLATGSTTDQTSQMQTLGNAGYFTYKNFLIDKAWVGYTPAFLQKQGNLEEFKTGFGKFDNPFMRYSTAIVWDADITPEGAYEQALFNLSTGGGHNIKLQTTTGQFIVNENTAPESDAQIWAYQAALTDSTTAFGSKDAVDLATAVSFYDYTNWFQTVSNNTTGVSFLRNNTLAADDFRVLDFYEEFGFKWNEKPVVGWFQYATNLANVGTDDTVRSAGNSIHDDDDAWGLGWKLGKTKKKGDWELSYGFYRIGVNAVVAAFNDSDFAGPGQVGFTNRLTHRLGLVYQLTDAIALNLKSGVGRALHPNAVVAHSSHETVYRTQMDLDYKF